MTQVGFCKRCDAPVTAMHAEAGAVQMNCAHSWRDIVWLSPAAAHDSTKEET